LKNYGPAPEWMNTVWLNADQPLRLAGGELPGSSDHTREPLLERLRQPTQIAIGVGFLFLSCLVVTKQN
jgi:hypothetical protein